MSASVIIENGELLAGLIGRGIAMSRTPAMHVAEAEAQGMSASYRLLDPELTGMNLAQTLNFAEAEGFNGVNITFPFKIEVIGLLDELSDNARAVGAVNTVVFRDAKRFGHNTDLWGFAESVRQGLAGASMAHVLQIGAGGAGGAVAHALADTGVSRLSIYDTDQARAATLVRQVAANRPNVEVGAVADLPALVASSRPDGVVNATPVGMAKLPGSAFPHHLIDPAMWVADIVYFPLETELLHAARTAGCRVLPGSGMAVFQAVRAFELFTGRPADPSRMKARFDAFDRET